MGKKEKPIAGGGTKKAQANPEEDVKREQKLQAVLIADSFAKTFRPITWESPKVLLPLVNVPMLEYTVEFLAQNGVEELLIFCVWHAKLIEDYIKGSKWSSMITVRCITSTTCLSAGDALRELDTMGVIRSDPFILITGDVISNMDLKKAIAYHKEKRKLDYNAILTVVLKEVEPATGAKAIVEDLVVGMDRRTSQLLLFEDSYKNKSVDLPVEILQEHPNMNFRTDLLDCHVDICSPEFIMQFSDNFDYQDIRRDFIRNEVLNWDLGMHIYGYVLQNEYAARVHDPHTYHSISRDIVTRWVYPITPDAQLVPGSSYVHSKRYVYKEQNVSISRSAKIGESVVLGGKCVIEDNVSVDRTIVGANCVIGARSVVVESHLWEGVVLESNVRVSHSIICNGARIKSGAVIPRGCIISYGVTIGQGVVLPEFSRVSLRKKLVEEDSWEPAGTGGNKKKEKSSNKDNVDEAIPEYDIDIIGPDGKGFVWSPNAEADDDGFNEDNDSDSEDETSTSNAVGLRKPDVLRCRSMGCVEQEAWKSQLWVAMPLPEDEDGSEDGSSMGDDDNDAEDEGGEMPIDSNGSSSDFVTHLAAENEVHDNLILDMIVSGYSDNNTAEDMVMEIKSYKLAENLSFVDCIRAVIPALLSISVEKSSHLPSKVIAAWNGLMKPKSPGQGWGCRILSPLIQDAIDELQVVDILEEIALIPANTNSLRPIFHIFLQILHESGIVSEDALLQWVESQSENDDTDGKLMLFKQCESQAFIKSLVPGGGDGDDDQDVDDSNSDSDSQSGDSASDSED